MVAVATIVLEHVRSTCRVKIGHAGWVTRTYHKFMYEVVGLTGQKHYLYFRNAESFRDVVLASMETEDRQW